jgi:hypothetical protein
MANYQTVFDVGTVPFNYGAAGFLLLVGALCIWWGIHRLRSMSYDVFSYFRAFKAGMLAIAGFGVFVFIGHDWWTHQSLQAAATTGEGIEQVEGIVQDHWIKEQTRETSDDVRVELVEHFRISHIDFQFAQTKSQGRYFTNAADHPVKLRDGMRLRVVYVAVGNTNKIVKLEVAQ